MKNGKPTFLTYTLRGKAYENQSKKVGTDLIVIFNSITDISFLKYVTKLFCVSYYFLKNFWECFKVQLSVAVCVYILSSKGANQLQVLYIRLWETSKETYCMEFFSTEAAVLKCIPINFSLEICRSFRTSSKKLVLTNCLTISYYQ